MAVWSSCSSRGSGDGLAVVAVVAVGQQEEGEEIEGVGCIAGEGMGKFTTKMHVCQIICCPGLIRKTSSLLKLGLSRIG